MQQPSNEPRWISKTPRSTPRMPLQETMIMTSSTPPMDPQLDVQQQVNTSGDLIQNLRDELRQAELEAQKKLLVDTFYNEVNRARRQDRL